MNINFNEMLRSLVDAANRHEALMDGTTGPVQAILESADVVWAVFSDPMEEGLGNLIIKGAFVLEEAALGRWAGPLRCTAIKTIDRAMAIAARDVLGDGASCPATSSGEVLN